LVIRKIGRWPSG